MTANKRGAGKGGFAVVWRAGRVWPALPDRDRSGSFARRMTPTQIGLILAFGIILGCNNNPKSAANGLDFAEVDSQAKAEVRLQRGELEKTYLFPPMFGGKADSRNVVYVPVGFGSVKSNIDSNIIRPLIAEGKVTHYEAIPEYQGKSFVPIAIKIIASDPSSFTSTIKIWGGALTQKP